MNLVEVPIQDIYCASYNNLAQDFIKSYFGYCLDFGDTSTA